MQQLYYDVSLKALLKRFVLIYLPIVIALSIILLTSIRFEKQIELKRIEGIEKSRIEIAKAHITQDFEGVDSDLRVIACQSAGSLELFFYPALRDNLKSQVRQSPKVLRFSGLRKTI